nr:hypothetical protein [Tanacetum cinerariifolium]
MLVLRVQLGSPAPMLPMHQEHRTQILYYCRARGHSRTRWKRKKTSLFFSGERFGSSSSKETNNLNKKKRKRDSAQSVLRRSCKRFTSNIIGGTKLRWRLRRERKETLAVYKETLKRIRVTKIKEYSRKSVERVSGRHKNNNNESRNKRACFGATRTKPGSRDFDCDSRTNSGQQGGYGTFV